MFSLFTHTISGKSNCVATIEGSIFSVRSFGAHFFICGQGVCMKKDFPKKIIDVTGLELLPGEPDACHGNGEHGFECCCDECDYFLLCFPEFDVQIKKENIATSKDNTPK